MSIDLTPLPPTEPPAPPRPGKPSGLHIPGTRGLLIGLGLSIFSAVMLVVPPLRGSGAPQWVAIGSLAALFSVVALAVGFRWRVRFLRLWRDGSCVRGEIVRSWRSRVGSGSASRNRYYARYRYTVDGRELTNSRETGYEVEPRAVFVVYDPAEPTRSLPQW
jgi:hypothetical protein